MTTQEQPKELYKMRWQQRNYSSPSGVDWYDEVSGARVYHGLDELIRTCRLQNIVWDGDLINWVGVYEAVEGTQKTKDGEPIYHAGKLLREIRPAKFDEVTA